MIDFDEIRCTFRNSALPIYRALAEALRARIVSGELPNGERLPSEEEMAALFGINHLTLRKSLKILSDLQLITQCQGRGTFVSYHSNEHLRIGVLIGDVTMVSKDNYFIRMIAEFSIALNQYNGELVILDLSKSGNIADIVNQAGCNALLVLHYTKVNRDICKTILGGIPTVFIGGTDDDIYSKDQYCVRTSFGAATEAVEHLYAMGHRKIACVTYLYNKRTVLDADMFERACRKYGITTEYLVKLDQGWFNEIRTTSKNLCLRPNFPTAFIEPGFSFSYAAWMGILDAGKRIPEDISFIGFDPDQNSNPVMSAMMQPFEKIAVKAIDLLFSMRVKGKHLKQHIYEFPAEFVDNGSCAAVPLTIIK